MPDLESSVTHSPAHDGVAGHTGWTCVAVEEIGIAPVAQEFQVPPVDEQRIVLTTSGRRHVEAWSGSGWRGAVYAPGSLGTTAPGVPTHLRWRFLDERPATEVHVHLPGPEMRRVADELGQAAAPLPDALSFDDSLVEQLALTLLAGARSALPELYAQSAAELLAGHLLLRRPRRPPSPERARVGRAVEYLRDNLQRPLTLSEIADSVGLSRHHFLRVFKRETGVTPFRYLQQLRVEEASRHLRHGRRSITDIAYLCGFSSHAALSSTFREVMGTTPSRYRLDACSR